MTLFLLFMLGHFFLLTALVVVVVNTQQSNTNTRFWVLFVYFLIVIVFVAFETGYHSYNPCNCNQTLPETQ